MPAIPGTLVPPKISSAPSSPVTGQMYYNTGDNTLYWWNGSSWIPAKDTGGSSLVIERKLLNGVIKDHTPTAGIDGVNVLEFDPTAQTWVAGMSVACPQGYVFSLNGKLDGSPSDQLWSSRNVFQDTGFYATVKSSSGGKYFASNLKRKSVSGSSEPTADSSTFGWDGTTWWGYSAFGGATATWRGNYATNTVYAVGDHVVADGSVWAVSFVLGGATSGGTAPNWSSVAPNYGDSVFDNSQVFFIRYAANAGLWAATTSYSMHVQSSNKTKLYGDLIRTSGGKILLWGGAQGTFATAGGSEPSWSSAVAGEHYEDNEILWSVGSEFGNQSQFTSGGAERLVLTGLQAPSVDGTRVVIRNIGTGEMSVVLADKANITDLSTSGATTTDVDPSSTTGFDFGGTFQSVLQAGEEVELAYNATAGVWRGAKVPRSIPGGATVLFYKLYLNPSGDPGSGYMGATSTWSTATTLRLSKTDRRNVNVNAILDALDDSTNTNKGQIRVFKQDDPTKWALYNITAISAQTNHYNITTAAVAASQPGPFGLGNSSTVNYGDTNLCVEFTRTGDKGADGVSAGLKYTYSNDTTNTDPTSGKIKFDSTTLASITAMRISETDADSQAVAAIIQAWDDSSSSVKATVTIEKDFAPANFLILQITGTFTDNGTWDSCTVSYVGSGGSFTNGDTVRVRVSRTGDAGAGGSIASDTHAATSKTTPVDADEMPLVDSAASFGLKKLTWANLKATLKTYFDGLYPSGSGTSTGTNTGDQTSVSGNAGTATTLATSRNIDGQAFNGSADITVIAPGTHAATSKTTPLDADEFPIVDTAASNVLKKVTFTNLKAFMKTYWDTLYLGISATAAAATKLITARNIDGQAFDGTADITVIAPGTHAATGKTTPVDADELPIVDSAASNVLKKLTWANLKATLKTYFDTLYTSSAYAVIGAYNTAIANTETVVVSKTFAANELTTGMTFMVKAWLTRSGTNSSSAVIRIRIGTTTLTGNIAATNTPPAAGVASPIEIDAIVSIVSNGAGGTARGSITVITHLGAVTVTPSINPSTGTVAVDTTAANQKIELTFISGQSSNTYTVRHAAMWRIA